MNVDSDARLDAALTAFATALDGPTPPTIAQFLCTYPEIAEHLGPLLESVVAVQGLGRKPSPVEPNGVGPGTQVGPYRLLREIGRGGMGVVYEADETVMPRRVAVKVVSAGQLDPAGRAALLREARIAAVLQHPNIVPVLAAGEVDGVAYIAMQYIDGRPLSAVIRARRIDAGFESAVLPSTPSDSSLLATGLSAGFHAPNAVPSAPTASVAVDGTYIREVAALGVQAADALAFVHENGVLHRDVKPGNFLLDVRGHLWLSDFGLARAALKSEETLGTRVGTLRYASPEQAAGGPLDPRSDLYALGATLYELLTLHPAFAGDDPRLLTRIQDEEPVSVRRFTARVPVDLATVIHKAMAKRPNDRYTSATAFADDLKRFLNGEHVEARPLSRRQRLGRLAYRRRKPLAFALAMLFVGLSIAGIVAWRGYRAEAQARQELENREAILRELVSEVNKSEAVFRHLPNGQPEHRRLVRVLKDVVCKWADEPNATDETRTEAVRACLRFGELELNMGEKSEGLAGIEEALRRVTELLKGDPAKAEWRFLRAQGLQYLAGTSAKDANPDFADTLAKATEATELLEGLIKEYPDRTEYRNPLSHLARTVGINLTSQGRYAEAAAMHRKALEADLWLAKRYPDDHPQSYIRLALSWYALAHSHLRLGDAAAAEQSLREATRNDDILCEPRFAYPKTNREYTINFRVKLAGFLIGQCRDDEARVHLVQAIRDDEEFVRQYPDRNHSQWSVADAYRLLAELEFLAGNREASREAYRKSERLEPLAKKTEPIEFVWNQLRHPFADLRELGRAESVLEEWAHTNPGADFRLPRLKLAVMSKDLDRSLKLLEPLNTIAPESSVDRVTLLLLKAHISTLQGRLDLAKQYLREADLVPPKGGCAEHGGLRLLRKEVEDALRAASNQSP